jgi:glycopeptide antibiotics resistance protein
MNVWKWWVLVVIAVSGPWYGMTRHPQWHRVTWIPFHGAEDKPRDVAANFALWVPFGLSFASERRGWPRIAAVVSATFGISCAVEAAQLFFVLRDPSATDVVVGMAGGAAGSLAAQALHWGDARRPARWGKAREARGEQ